jgi:hypothetical protein
VWNERALESIPATTAGCPISRSLFARPEFPARRSEQGSVCAFLQEKAHEVSRSRASPQEIGDVGHRRSSLKPLAAPRIRTGALRSHPALPGLPTTQHSSRPRMRLSLKESRTKLLNATNLDRKSGIRGPKTLGDPDFLLHRTSKESPRLSTGNPGERSGEICGSAVPSWKCLSIERTSTGVGRTNSSSCMRTQESRGRGCKYL